MSPLQRYYSLILVATVMLMFGAVAWWAPRLGSLAVEGPIASTVATVVAGATSVGTYRLLAKAFDFLLIKSKWVKKKVFGSQYVEGQWMGYVVGASGGIHLVIEYIDQDFDGVTLRGESYDMEHRPHAIWYSESVLINSRMGVITYHYKCDIVEKRATHDGIGSFIIVRKCSKEPPDEIHGTVTDIVNGIRLRVAERKVIGSSISTYSALALALEYAGQREGKYLETPAKSETSEVTDVRDVEGL